MFAAATAILASFIDLNFTKMTEREKEREQMVTTIANVEYETLQDVHAAPGDTLSYKFSYPDLSKSISVHYSSLLEFNGDRLSQ